MDIIFADSMRIPQFAFINKTTEQGRIHKFQLAWYTAGIHLYFRLSLNEIEISVLSYRYLQIDMKGIISISESG